MAKIGLIERLFVAEVQCFETFKALQESTEQKNHEASLREQCKILEEIHLSGELDTALAAEELCLRRELTTYSNSPEETRSLSTALEQLNEAKQALRIVRDPDIYRAATLTYSSKRRENLLPLDAFREFVRSHATRLGNRMASQISRQEKIILQQRKENLIMMNEKYKNLQKEALEIQQS